MWNVLLNMRIDCSNMRIVDEIFFSFWGDGWITCKIVDDLTDRYVNFLILIVSE